MLKFVLKSFAPFLAGWLVFVHYGLALESAAWLSMFAAGFTIRDVIISKEGL